MSAYPVFILAMINQSTLYTEIVVVIARVKYRARLVSVNFHYTIPIFLISCKLSLIVTVIVSIGYDYWTSFELCHFNSIIDQDIIK